MSIPEMRQAIFEKLGEIEDSLAVRYTKGATLYINPTNGFGDRVVPRKKGGRRVKNVYSKGPYRSAADKYEP